MGTEHGLSTHLDGARLFNAVVGSGIERASGRNTLTRSASVSVRDWALPWVRRWSVHETAMQEARWHRKCFGGGMRQAGIIAAGALFALENNIDRLADDHANARRLGEALAEIDGLRLIGDSVDTNIIMFEIDSLQPNVGQLFADRLEQQGVQALSLGPDSIRLVTHLDVSADQIDAAVDALQRTHQQLATHA